MHEYKSEYRYHPIIYRVQAVTPAQYALFFYPHEVKWKWKWVPICLFSQTVREVSRGRNECRFVVSSLRAVIIVIVIVTVLSAVWHVVGIIRERS